MKDKIDTLIRQAATFRKQRQYSESLRLLEEAGALARTHRTMEGKVRLEQGIVHLMSGDQQGAARLIRDALKKDPSQASAAEKVAEFARGKGYGELSSLIAGLVESIRENLRARAAAVAAASPQVPDSPSPPPPPVAMRGEPSQQSNQSQSGTCPFCQAGIDPSASKCRFCGEWLGTAPAGLSRAAPIGSRACPECGTIVPANAVLCTGCGLNLRRHGLHKPLLDGSQDLARIVTGIGFLLSVGGCFAPFVQVPILGSLSLFLNGRGDGVFIVILAIAGVICVAVNKPTPALVVSIVSLGIAVWKVFVVLKGMPDAAGGSHEDGGEAFGKVLAASIGLSWGAFVLVLGCVVAVVGSGLMVTRAKR